MNALLFYLLKLSISLAVVYIFYQAILHRLTFYNWNRWYLVFYTLLSFVVPFINISPALEQSDLVNSNIVAWVPVIKSAATRPGTYSEISNGGFSTLEILSLAFLTGVLILIGRFVVQLISYRKMLKRSVCISEGEINIYQVNDKIVPFSFGKSVFINPALHPEEDLREIILHEFVHIRQRHSFDIIWSEIICIVCWFNPFAWLLKRVIRQNLEFIADNKVLDSGINKKEYQYLLLKVTGNNQYSIATPFNFSSLKKRIAMMNKLKSARVNSLRFLFILPVLAVIILSFRKELKNSFTGRQSLPIKASASVRDTVPDAPLPPPPPEPKKLPNDVERISISNNIATVVLKNGSKEVYNLQKPVDKKSFEKKYGSVVPPVPPPPPAPASPVSVTENAPVAVAGVETVSVTDAPVAVAGYAVAPSPVTVTVAGVAMPTTGVVTKTIPGVSVASGHLAVTEASGDFITGDEAIIITITKNTTRQELDAFVKQMKEKGVEMTYDEIKYNNDGVLVNISGDLRSKTGHSNFVGQGFSKLVLALMKKGEKTWFRVIVTDGKAEI